MKSLKFKKSSLGSIAECFLAGFFILSELKDYSLGYLHLAFLISFDQLAKRFNRGPDRRFGVMMLNIF